MKTIIRATFLLCIIIASLSCCSKSVEELQAGGAEKGYATGKVVDGTGTAIDGAKVVLDNTVFYASYIHGSTNEEGIYKIAVQQGSWQTFAYIDKIYNGQTYTMELFPDKIDSFTEEGGVRNFIWKLEGRMPWEAESYCGGTVELTQDFGFYEDEKDIELTLTPSGPLIDGTTGRTLTLRYGEEKWKHRSNLEDIPIGRYKVTAKLKKNGTSVPLKIDDWYNRDGLESDFRLDFIPKPNHGINNSASIVIGY